MNELPPLWLGLPLTPSSMPLLITKITNDWPAVILIWLLVFSEMPKAPGTTTLELGVRILKVVVGITADQFIPGRS